MTWKRLSEMSAKVREETGTPWSSSSTNLTGVVRLFCLELLERVKDIFDVPNLVSEFRINRDELCSSLESFYGTIDPSIYLRRDMEFLLLEVDAANFGRHLMQKFGLATFFESLSVREGPDYSKYEFQGLFNNSPEIWARLGLSLRDRLLYQG